MEAVNHVDTGPVSLGTLFAGYELPGVVKKKRTSERAELVRYFYEHALSGWPGKRPLSPGYMGMKLSHLSLMDLYAFKSMCEDRSRNGYAWGKFFWGSLKAEVRPWQVSAQ